MTNKSKPASKSASKTLIGKRVILPGRKRRRGVIVDRDGEYVVVITPDREYIVRAADCQPEHGNPHDRDTVPF